MYSNDDHCNHFLRSFYSYRSGEFDYDVLMVFFILQVNWCRLSNCLWPTPRFWPFWPSLLNATTSSRGRWEPATLAPACGRFSSSWPSGFLDAWPQGKQPKIDVFVQTVEMSVINSDCWLQTILLSLLDLQLKALFNQKTRGHSYQNADLVGQSLK